MQARQLKAVNVHHLQEKFKSKKELYHFLTQDCKAFLPKLESTNGYFFKDVVRGAKEVTLHFLH